VSTLPALAGQKVALFVRQKVAASNLKGQRDMTGRVVLFVHGATVPGVPAYDLEYRTYGWMGFLARAGFNVYAMDVSGYGSSPRPMMDDPCNVDPKQQSLLQGRPLKTACAPNYPYDFNTINDDWAEMDTVVDHLRKSNGVERIHMIGWSAGGPRVGGYVAKHPAKIDRVLLYAPSPLIARSIPDRPAPGFPVALQTREDFEQKRWDPDVRCAGQLEPGIRDVLWKSIMEWDRVGASWRSGEGVMRARNATGFGWTRDLAAKVVAPTLVIAGEFDRLADRRAVYEQLGSKDKLFVNVSCASHFMVWEKQHRALQDASLEWFRDGRLQGISRGELRVDPDGRFLKQ
jgi:pimeloyl-ACP methyl ester carboxylesterase